MRKKPVLQTRDDIQLVRPMILNKIPTEKDKQEISEWISRYKSRKRKKSLANPRSSSVQVKVNH